MVYLKTRQQSIGITEELLSQKQSRNYFSIQNRDAVNNVFVSMVEVDGTAIVAANSILVGPGEFYDIQVPNGQEIRAIATVAPVSAIVTEG